MSEKEFESLLCTITAGVVNKIIAATNWNEDKAMEAFVNSEVYSMLENEKTKVWHYSTTMLTELFFEEQAGKLEWPEVAL